MLPSSTLSVRTPAGPSVRPPESDHDSPARAWVPGAPNDPHDFAHAIVEGAFGLVFPDPQARQALRLAAISRCRADAMTWYLWTLDRSGAYALALDPQACDTVDGAALTLRYYPAPGEPVFHRFAPVEREIRVSPLFDASGTPAFATAATIPPDLFRIGSLELSPQRDDRCALRVRVPQRWIVEAAYGAANTSTRLRDVPAARLAWPVVDALVGALVYLGRAPPSSVALWRHGGAVGRLAADGRARSGRVLARCDWALEICGLALPGRATGYDAGCEAPGRVEAPWFMHAGPTPPSAAPRPVNPLWWSAADWRFDPVGAYCGHCAAEDAVHDVGECRAPRAYRHARAHPAHAGAPPRSCGCKDGTDGRDA